MVGLVETFGLQSLLSINFAAIPTANKALKMDILSDGCFAMSGEIKSSARIWNER